MDLDMNNERLRQSAHAALDSGGEPDRRCRRENREHLAVELMAFVEDVTSKSAKGCATPEQLGALPEVAGVLADLLL